jgi:hypothetical protein
MSARPRAAAPSRDELPAYVGPDAKLVSLCQEVVNRERAHLAACQPYWDQGQDPPQEVMEQMRASVPGFHRTRRKIGTTPATTVPGLLAKARMIVEYAGPMGVPPEDDDYVA